MLEVSILSPGEIIFKGRAKSIVLPGNDGVFEILPFHKNLFSRLLRGNIIMDGQLISIQRGVVKVEDNTVTIIVEESYES